MPADEPQRTVTAGNLSGAIQDTVRAIYLLERERNRRATTTALAGALGVSPSTVTAMLKKLDALGLVEHAPYRGARLTPAGERVALEVVRHHRLLESYLATTLALPIDQLHAEADRLEHALSEELEARIDAQLGHPTHDPHGDPIPNQRLEMRAGSSRTIGDLAEGDEARIERVPDGDPELLRYLLELGLVPGRLVSVLRRAPFDGPVTVSVSGREHAISRELAGAIAVA